MILNRYGGRYSSISIFLLSWAIVALLAINVLYFVLRVSNPVIQADGWYYLQSFLKKAFDHTLTFSDFFIKRDIDDHAAPLFRLLLLVNYHYFDIDYVLDAITGCIAAMACCLIYRNIIFSGAKMGNSKNVTLSICWMAICALVLSLNSTGIWVWPLVSLENLTQLFILLFMVIVWHAHCSQRYLALVVTTLVLSITSDDSALIAVIAVIMTYGLMLFFNPSHRSQASWKIFLAVGICVLVVRIGYACLPFDYAKHSHHTLRNFVPMLPTRFMEGGWWQWALLPLVLPIYFQNPLGPAHLSTWHTVRIIIAIPLLLAHIAFWRRALRVQYDLTAFVAVSLMLLTYGWIIGIVLWRVSWGGNSYLEQPRYVLFYAGNLIALLLMWASSSKTLLEDGHSKPALGMFFFRGLCLFLLLLQIPQSLSAWESRQSEWAYYTIMAHQMRQLARSPMNSTDCALLTICGRPPSERAALISLLKENRLNIFSPKVRRWHPYLSPPREDTN